MNQLRTYVIEFERVDHCTCKTMILKKSYSKDFTAFKQYSINAFTPSRALMSIKRYHRAVAAEIKRLIEQNGHINTMIKKSMI